jgi:hypothetical protein
MTRSWIERWHGLDGDLWKVKVLNCNEVIAEWIHPQIQKIKAQIDFDSIVQDAVKMVYPDE